LGKYHHTAAALPPKAIARLTMMRILRCRPIFVTALMRDGQAPFGDAARDAEHSGGKMLTDFVSIVLRGGVAVATILIVLQASGLLH
jgi:hypothetical protein